MLDIHDGELEPTLDNRRKITRRAVFARDRWTCQYCGTESAPRFRVCGQCGAQLAENRPPRVGADLAH